MIVIPEIILLQSFKNVLKYIRADFAAATDETKSLLYIILGANQVQRYALFTQAKSVIITDENNPRHLDVNLFFNAKRAGIPTIHITLPSESEKNNVLSIGEGFREPYYDEANEVYRRTFNRRYTTKYNIIITSDNTNEVILLYHFLRSLTISLTEHLNLSSLENVKISGSDISLNSDIVPANIFARGMGLDIEYDVEAVDLFSKPLVPFDIAGVDSIPLDPDISVSF